MLTEKKAVLISGSPKAKDSTSMALGSYIAEKLKEEGFGYQTFRACAVDEGHLSEALKAVDEAAVVVVSFPLYVDGLPAPLIGLLEQIHAHRKENLPDKEQYMVAVANCGFPESFHNETALKICKRFAETSNFKWLGGLALGGGPAISGRPLEPKGMTGGMAQALDMAVGAILQKQSIPKEAYARMTKPLIPARLYTTIASFGWRQSAKKSNAHKDLYAKPYKHE